MKKTKRELLVLAAATTVALSMGVTVQAKGDEKVLNFGCQMYTDGCVNSANDENGGWNAMRYGIAEALFKFDDNMEVIPWLAESYEVNDEHTEWTIKLKDGIKFSDGCDLTPTKVKEYFDHMKEVGPSGSAKPENRLELEPKARLKTLSKGSKEKVQLILAMSRAAKLYLLDEPIGGVDPAARDYILSTILNNYSRDATVILSTHLIGDIEPILDEAVFLKDGRVFAHRNAEELRETEGMSVDAYFREVFKC